MRVSLPSERYPEETQQIEFFEQVEEEIRSLPGVASVASAGTIPLVGDTSNSALNFEDHPVTDPADRVFVGNHSATPGYLETMGITLLEGREFTLHETSSGWRWKDGGGQWVSIEASTVEQAIAHLNRQLDGDEERALELSAALLEDDPD